MLWVTNRLNYLIEQDPLMDKSTIDYHFNRLIKDAEEQYVKDIELKRFRFYKQRSILCYRN